MASSEEKRRGTETDRPMEPAVSVRNLGYRYRGQEKPALDGVSLEVTEGEFVVVMGPSGARARCEPR